jgi:hypothetical protein
LHREKSPSGAGDRSFARTALGLVAVASGVALRIRGGISLLAPAAFLVALMPFQKTKSILRYLLLLGASLLVPVAVGVAYALFSHKAVTYPILVSSGLIFIAIGWLQGPGSRQSTA